MVKKENLYYMLSILIIIISTMSYNVYVYYDYYKYFQIIISMLIIIMLCIFMKYETALKKRVNEIFTSQIYILLIFALMIFNTIAGFFLYRYNSLLSIINVLLIVFCSVLEFYVLPCICDKYTRLENKIINFLIIFCFFLSFFSLLIELNHGQFLGYKFVNVRNASIFYDPNFAAMIFGAGFLLALKNKFKKKIVKIIMLVVIGIAIILTGSRGTLLSIVLALCIFLFIYLKINPFKRLLLIIIFAFATYFGLRYLYLTDFFRVYQGSNNRIEMWMFTIKEIIRHPFIGYGYQSITKFLNINYFSNASTHNSFLDFAFAYGIPCLILYLYLIISILINALKNRNKSNEKYILVTIFFIINANTILYSFGGVGIGSLLFTFFLGMLNYKLKNKNKEMQNSENKYNCTSI